MSLHRTDNQSKSCHLCSLSLQIYHSPESPDREKHKSDVGETPGATCRGSLTVEAALVLTLFLFFWIALLSLFPAMQLHITLRNAMEQTAAETAMLAYGLSMSEADRYAAGTEEASLMQSLADGVGANGYFYGRIVSLVGREYLNTDLIQGGSGGISLLGSCLPGEDPDVKLVLSYVLKIPFFPVIRIPVSQQVCQRAWTGAGEESSGAAAAGAATPVYVAENGSVYHISQSCTHLLLSVQQVELESVAGLRNEDGGKYYPCERCMQGEAHTVVYITAEGNRYHSDRHCAGIKRTVTETTLGATDLPPCSRCAQGGN